MAGPGAVVITGSAGGIGTALRVRLEAQGHPVVGVDVRDAELILDLADPSARADLAGRVAERAPGGVAAVVAAAGLLGMGPDPEGASDRAADAVSVNYFSAVATLAGLRRLLAGRPGAAAVAVGSHMATTQPISPATVEACLSGDEGAARAAARAEPGLAYSSSKLALERWVRRQAPGSDWIGSGITLNAVALGLVDTPMTSASIEFILGHPEILPIPARRPARPEEAAAAIAFLLSEDARFFCGSVLYMDGGSDALTRGEDWPAPLPHPAAP